MPEHAATGPRDTVPAATAAATSDWFRSRPSTATGTNGSGNGTAATTAAVTTPATAPPATAPPEARRSAGSDEWSVGKHAAQIVAEPVRGDFTAAGLPTRVPQANLIPGSVGGSRAPGGGAAGRPGSGPEAQVPTTPRSPRSPDVARSRLSGFQSGVRRAKGLTPDSEEGADS